MPILRVMAVELGGGEVKVMAVIVMNSHFAAFRPLQWEATIEDVPNLDFLFSPGDFKPCQWSPKRLCTRTAETMC